MLKAPSTSSSKVLEEMNNSRPTLVSELDVIFNEFCHSLYNVETGLTGELLNNSSEAFVVSNIGILGAKSFGHG